MNEVIDLEEYKRDYETYTALLEVRPAPPLLKRPNFEAVETFLSQDFRQMYDALEREIVLIIAHRMRTVESANKLVVLDRGIVAELGGPAELMKQNGAFARIVKLQTESQTWFLGQEGEPQQ